MKYYIVQADRSSQPGRDSTLVEEVRAVSPERAAESVFKRLRDPNLVDKIWSPYDTLIRVIPSDAVFLGDKHLISEFDEKWCLEIIEEIAQEYPEESKIPDIECVGKVQYTHEYTHLEKFTLNCKSGILFIGSNIKRGQVAIRFIMDNKPDVFFGISTADGLEQFQQFVEGLYHRLLPLLPIHKEGPIDENID